MLEDFIVSPSEQRRRIAEARARLGILDRSNKKQAKIPVAQRPEQPEPPKTGRPWIDQWDDPTRPIKITFQWSDALAPRRVKHLGFRECAAFVAARFGLSFEDVLSTNKSNRRADARQIAWWILHRNTSRGFANIARLCDRDHTTVIHGVQKVTKHVEDQTAFGALAAQIEQDFLDEFHGISGKVISARFDVQ